MLWSDRALVCKWSMSERICFHRSELYSVSDSIDSSNSTSPALHLKVAHCALSSIFFSICFQSVLMVHNKFLGGKNVNRDSPDLIVGLIFFFCFPFPLFFPPTWAYGFASADREGATTSLQQSKINQSNQKNITEYIRAGRCRSLPSSSIDL